MGSFADGLRLFFFRDSMRSKRRMTHAMRVAINDALGHTMENTFDMRDDEHDLTMRMSHWLRESAGISPSMPREALTVELAGHIHRWAARMSDLDCWEGDWQGAAEWINDKLTRRYSLAEMAIGETDARRIKEINELNKER